jgi:hypothetical protein
LLEETMSTSLAEALQGVELRRGQTYRCEVKGLLVELRVLETGPNSEAPALPESDIMLDAWTELPEPRPGVVGRSELGEPDLSDLPDIPQDEKVP